MLVIVTGSRKFNNYPAIREALGNLQGVSRLWHGGAPGADTLAGVWAGLNSIPVKVWPPDWKANRKAAGVIRSRKMCDAAPPGTLVVAFIKGPICSSPGTAACIKAAKSAGLIVKEIRSW